MGPMLSTKQMAVLKGCTQRNIKKLIQGGKIKAFETVNNRNQKVYQIPLEYLDEALQQKWLQQSIENPPEGVELQESGTPAVIDQFSEEERMEIDFWTELINRWQDYRNMSGVKSKEEVDRKFLALCELEYPDRKISMDILYRKWKAVKNNDMKGLVDMRGKWRKGKSNIDDTVWQAFLFYYLSQKRHPITKCLEYTKMWAREMRPDPVSYTHLQ